MNPLERIISTVAPHVCIGCGKEGSLVCGWCEPGLFLPLPSRCYRCHKSTSDSKVCRSCRASTPLKHVWVVAEYDDAAKALISLLKFGRAAAAAKTVANYMDACLPLLERTVLISEVPTATSRVRQRGYDQSKLIAKQLSGLRKTRFASLLGRLGQSRQVGAKRQQRTKQLERAFYPRHQGIIKGADILLVDDVTTTGATLEAAAAALKQAGAKSVSAVVFAQKQ